MVFTGQEGTAPQPHLAALILNPSLRWVSPEPESTNQGDSSHTTNASGAGSARQREQERRGKKKKESSRDKITRQDRRLGAAGAGSPAQESALATPVSTRARPADAPSLDGSLGRRATPYLTVGRRSGSQRWTFRMQGKNLESMATARERDPWPPWATENLTPSSLLLV